MADSKAVLTITLSTGEIRVHEFAIENLQQLITWATFYGQQLNNVFESSTAQALIVHNPVVVYNREHLVSIQVDIVGSPEYEQVVEEIIPNQMGFQPPTQDSKR